ncbi:MAG: SUMF1/EgtB/PvdO family nonheme iron enzyme [Polyangiaceae bacterium]
MSDQLDLRPGEVFNGRYVVERRLAAGGMGAVYVVQHSATHKRHALKLMHANLVRSEAQRTRFLREATIGALIDDADHIVNVTDAGIDEASGAPFIVMELLQGRELGDILDERGRLPPNEALGILKQLATALAAAHAKGVIHRDIKPANLFIVERPGKPAQLKVLDFGIAKIMDGVQATSTMAGGTLLYMAPEQTEKAAQVGARTDVWAFGLVAYRVLVGYQYWEGDDLSTVMRELLAFTYEPATKRALKCGVTLPPAFDTFFARTVAHRADDRVSSAMEAFALLQAAYPDVQIADSVIGSTSTTSPQTQSAGTMVSLGASQSQPVGPQTAVPAHTYPSAVVSDAGPRQAASPQHTPAGTMQSVPGATGPSATGPGATVLGDPIAASPLASTSQRSPSAFPAPPPRTPAKSGPPIALIAGGVVLVGAVVGGVLVMKSGATATSSSSATTSKSGAPSAETTGSASAPKISVASSAPPATSVAPTVAPAVTNSAVSPATCPAKMALIPGGKYRLASKDVDATVQDFCLDQLEVTVSDFEACVEGKFCRAASQHEENNTIDGDACNSGAPDRGDHPINCVDLSQASAYCLYVNKRLPTEEEWEWAARGGDEARRFPWGTEAPNGDLVNACGPECTEYVKKYKLEWGATWDPADAFPLTAPVGSFPKGANRWGVLDMAGNVFEWTSSGFDADSNAIRGGSFADDDPATLSVGHRQAPTEDSYDLGFRCAKRP